MIQFHPTQAEVVKDNHQFRVVNCGRQWGKTTLAVWEMFACAYAKKDREVAYFATTFGQARDIAWKALKDITRPVWAKEPNETRLELYIRTQDKGTSRISLRGFESVETTRGQQFDLIVLDEVSKMRNFMEGWQAVLLATLAFRNGSALFISTPYGFNHFHKLYQLGQGTDPHWKSWTFNSFDNPHLSRSYLQTIQSTVTPDFWAQEYLAEFRRFTGLIYQEFDLTKHVHEFEFSYNQHGDYYFGQDFAVRGWTAMVPGIVKTDGHIYILDNYKVESETAQTHATNEKTMLKLYAELDRWTGYADPAGWMKNQQKENMIWAIADEYLEEGLPLTKGNNEVTAGINYVRQMFQHNKIHIHPKCSHLIDELLQYQWKSQSDTRVEEEDAPERVRKINDHLVDAMRYMIYSKPTAPEEEVEPTGFVFPAVFPTPRIEPENDSGDHYTPLDIPSIFD